MDWLFFGKRGVHNNERWPSTRGAADLFQWYLQFQRLQRDHCAALGCPWSVHVCKYSMLLSQHVSRLYVFWWQQYTHVSCTTTAHKATTWRAAKTSEKNMKFHIFFLFEEMTVLQEWLDLFEKSHIAFAAACDHPPNNLWTLHIENWAQNTTLCVQNPPDWSRLVQIGPYWSRLVHIGRDWSRLFQIGPDWSDSPGWCERSQ